MKIFLSTFILLFFTFQLSANYEYSSYSLLGVVADENKSQLIQVRTTEKINEIVAVKSQSEYTYQFSNGTPPIRSSSCNETISAGQDEVFCWPGGSLVLEGYFSSSDYINLEWSPEEGLSDPNILQPSANVNSTTTYTLNISAISSENLIVNGDFEMGNTGFSSDYNFNPLNMGSLGQGSYSIQTNPIVGNPGFSECGDHTSGSGNMFIADGALVAGTQVWCQTVTVLPDTDYFFQFFVTSIFPVSPAELETTFNGNSVGTISPTSNTCEWLEFSTVWNSGGLSEVTICMVNLNIVGYGNDFALDDISLRRVCEYSDSVTITVLEEIRTQEEYVICSGDFIEISGQQFSEPGNYEVFLTSSDGCDSIIDLNIDLVQVYAYIENPSPITCENQQIVLDGSLSFGSEFEWTTFDGLILTDPNESIITVGAPGTYLLEVTNIENGHLCKDWFSVYVSIDTISPVFSIINPDPLNCSDSITTLQSVSFGLPPNAIIEWESETGNIVSGSNTLSPTVQGEGQYILTITDPNNGCFSSHSVDLLSDTLKPVLQVNDLSYITCRDSQVVLSVNIISPDSNYIFSWTTDEGNFVNTDTTLEPLVDAPAWYSIKVTDMLSGCESVANIQVIEDFFLPEIELPASDTFPCLEDSLAISLIVAPDSNIYHFLWTTLNGIILSGNQTANPVVGSAGDYKLIIENLNNGCIDSVWMEIIEDCPCITRSGEFQVDQLTFCEGENIDLSALNLEGTVEDEDFELFYVLHSGSANMIGTILATSQGAFIEWSPDFESGTEYFITAVISTVDNGEINFDEPCIDFSIGIPVVWIAGPVIEINGLTEICLGEELLLLVESEGPFPFTIQLTNDTGEAIDVEIIESYQTVNLPQNIGETSWTITTVDSECDATFSGTFTSIITAPLELGFLAAAALCNNTIFGSVFDLNNLIVGVSIDGVWLLDGDEISNGIVDFDGFDPGEYELIFSTEGFEDRCPGSSWSIFIDVVECDCPVLSLPEALRICSDNAPIDLMNISGQTASGEWTLRNPNEISTVPLIEDGFLVTNLEASGQFELVFTITDSLPEGCTIEYIILLEIEAFRFAGQALSELIELCENELSEINLFDYLTDFSDGGIWLDENREEVGEFLEVSDLSLGLNSYFYFIDGEGLCSPDEAEIKIELLPAPEYQITTNDPTCFGENDGFIIIENLDAENPIIAISLNGAVVNQNDLNNLSTGLYSLQITGTNECIGPLELVEIIEPTEYFVTLGEDIEAAISDEVLLSFETNLLDSLTNQQIWSDDAGMLLENASEIIYTVESETSISIALISVDGCLIEDAIRITIAEQGIYIPNVFRPNSDIDANSRFGPLGIELVSRVDQFSIFDRWGNRVHHVANVSPENPDLYWNGQARDRNASEGVYLYLLEYVDAAGRSLIRSGDVLLIR